MRYSISEAYAYPRNKRTSKASAILQRKLGEDVKVSNEVNNRLWQQGAQNPPKQIDVEVVEEDGDRVAKLEQ